jgi:hypothetical protein
VGESSNHKLTEIYGLPQNLTGSETVAIRQIQNGQIARCTMPIAQLITFPTSDWLSHLPVTEPSTAGVLWNNGGVVSIS